MAGVPLHYLQDDYWVPGLSNRADSAPYAGHVVWKEALITSGATCLLWIQRLTQDKNAGYMFYFDCPAGL